MATDFEFTVKLGGGIYKSNQDEILYPMTVVFGEKTKVSYLNSLDRLRLLTMVEDLKEAFEEFEVSDE